jgi:hypothetical protein
MAGIWLSQIDGRQPSFSGCHRYRKQICNCVCLSTDHQLLISTHKLSNMIQICRAEDGEVFQACPSYVLLATSLTGGTDECHTLGHRKVPRLHVMALAHRLNFFQARKSRAVSMQGDWDSRECGTGVSFRRAQVTNGQCAGPRRGTGPGASPTSAMLFASPSMYNLYVCVWLTRHTLDVLVSCVVALPPCL